MENYKYSFVAKLVYRFANIPVTMLLFVYFLIALLDPEKTLFNGISIAVHALLIYAINRFYYKNYKYFPYLIKIDNENMICSDYFLQRKEVTMKLSEITEITGGIFSNTPARPVYVVDVHGTRIGLSPHIKNYNKLVTRILSNIPQELYGDILQRIKDFGELNKKGIIKRKK
ncbi:MAG: hypothetical protein SCALA702_23790 [Melioribacteraceae bacterium]|nr:MAG: hypothetical protein SCALA702_23790 [Melioribacteraceae bacterium]